MSFNQKMVVPPPRPIENLEQTCAKVALLKQPSKHQGTTQYHLCITNFGKAFSRYKTYSFRVVSFKWAKTILTFFWKDHWIGNSNLKEEFSDLFLLSTSPDNLVAGFFDRKDLITMFRALLNGFGQLRYEQLKNLL